MKPDWSNAPERATAWAMDGSGKAYWYENKPVYNSFTGSWEPRGGFAKFDHEHSIKPENSLQERPK